MTTLTSNSTAISVNPPGTSTLPVLAAAMAPGTWLQVTSASGQNAAMGGGANSGSMLHFANNAAWNPMNQCIEYVGADHGWGSTMKYVRYSLATNTFTLVNAGGNASNSGTGPGHEFCGLAVNPYTGEGFYRNYGTVGVASFTVTRAALNGTAFSSTLPASPVTTQNIVAGSCWWRGSFVGAGAQGCFMIFNAGNSTGKATDGHIMGYDPLTNAWFYSQAGASPNYYDGTPGTYHEIAAYSGVKNCMVYGGGNAAHKKLWRLSANGSVLRMPDPPGVATVGIQQGNLCEDPVTGNFLLLSHSQLWELNPTGSGTWTQQTGARTPPVGVGTPDGAGLTGMVSCAIPSLGVVVYTTQKTASTSSFFLYKHA